MIRLEQVQDASGNKYYLLSIDNVYKKVLSEVTEKVDIDSLEPTNDPKALHIEVQ